MTTALVCDERRTVRERLLDRVSALASMTAVDSVTGGDELLTRYTREAVDIVLVGTQRALSIGVETTRRLLSAHPSAIVVVFGSPDDSQSITAAIAAGARGFLRWDATGPELLAMLADAALGGDRPGTGGSGSDSVSLTDRETQVLGGMCQGQSNGEIGRSLFLSEDTIKTHARRLFHKLGARDRAQAVAIGFRQGLIS